MSDRAGIGSMPLYTHVDRIERGLAAKGIRPGDALSPEQLFGNVETDSCGMLFALLINASSLDPTPLYVQCIGTFNRHSGTVDASCDSATVLKSPLTDPPVVVADCDLTLLLQATISLK